MFNYRTLLFNLLIVMILVVNNNSDLVYNPNCKQRPRKLIKTAQICCDVPQPDLDIYLNQCQSLGDNNATMKCQLECLFNISNALEVQNLNLAKLHKLLDNIFPNAAEFVAAYYRSYEECIPLVKIVLQELESLRKAKPTCEPTALFYAACAQMNLLKHCPKSAWNSTEYCEKGRSYVRKCAKNLLPHRNRGEQYRFQEDKKINYSTTVNTESKIPETVIKMEQ